MGGQVSCGAEIRSEGDPTTALLRVANAAREVGLGGVLGDLRRTGMDITRWEFYSAPFRIELAEELRERLLASWQERPPRRME